jgi:hypothetical protein
MDRTAFKDRPGVAALRRLLADPLELEPRIDTTDHTATCRRIRREVAGVEFVDQVLDRRHLSEN